MTKMTEMMQKARMQIIQNNDLAQLPAFDQLVKEAQMQTEIVLDLLKKPKRGMYLATKHLDDLDNLFMSLISATVDRCYQSTMKMMAQKIAEAAVMQKQIDELEARLGIVKAPAETMQ